MSKALCRSKGFQSLRPLPPDYGISNDPKMVDAYRMELRQEVFRIAVENSVKGGWCCP